LDRFGIVEGAMCVCLQDYETVDHLIWHCERFGSERHRLMDALPELDVQHGTPVRNLCGLRKWSAVKCCLDFLGGFRIRFWSDSLSVDVELEVCFIGPYMASASGPSRIRVTFKKKKKKKKHHFQYFVHRNLKNQLYTILGCYNTEI
jgi:hypothetical protein